MKRPLNQFENHIGSAKDAEYVIMSNRLDYNNCERGKDVHLDHVTDFAGILFKL